MECENIIASLKQKGVEIIPPKDISKNQLIYLLLEVLSDEKIIARNILRDIKIRAKYSELKAQGKTSSEARKILINEELTDREGNKYYLSEDTVRNILYSKKRRR